MKLVTYNNNGSEQLAFYHDGKVYDTTMVGQELPKTMMHFLQHWDTSIADMTSADTQVKSGALDGGKVYSTVEILAPVTHPTSCRDGYAFRQHVAAARRNRKVDMIAEFDQYPIFYFTNHNAIQGPGPIPVMPDHLKRLDFELEAAIVICKKGRNVRAAEADDYIGGYMIMNDMSARTLQMEEMLLNLGPAKGKDFSTVIGP
jgi:fumarylacetoacetate (FAA) hydrolase